MRILFPTILLLLCVSLSLLTGLNQAVAADVVNPTARDITTQPKKPYKDVTVTQMLGLQPMSVHDVMPDEDLGHFFEDTPYGKLRNKLKKYGVTIDIHYWPEFMANMAGGLRQKADYAHQIGFSATFDLEKLVGLKNTSIVFAGAERAGRRLSTDVFADNVYNPSQIYGGGGNVLFHLIYFYLQKTWMNNRIRWIIGRYATGPDYDASMLLCSFSGGALCSQPRASTLINGYASWPSTAWGTNIKIRPTRDTFIVPGVFTSEAQHGGTAGTNWHSATGVSLIGEAGWEPEFGEDRLNGHYRIGMMWDSTPFPYNWASRETGVHGSRHGQMMQWIMVDQMIWRHGNYSTAGLMLIGGFTHLTSSVSTISDQWYAGFLDFGLIPSRPYDGFGLVFSKFYYGKKVTAAYQPFMTRRRMSLTAVDDLVQQRPLMSTHETVMEAIYRIKVTNGIIFTPEFQYFWRPGGTGKVKNAPLLGFDMRVFF